MYLFDGWLIFDWLMKNYPDNFKKFHNRHRVEEMQTTEPEIYFLSSNQDKLHQHQDINCCKNNFYAINSPDRREYKQITEGDRGTMRDFGEWGICSQGISSPNMATNINLWDWAPKQTLRQIPVISLTVRMVWSLNNTLNGK